MAVDNLSMVTKEKQCQSKEERKGGNKKVKKILSVLLCVALMGTLLVACGGGGTETATGDQESITITVMCAYAIEEPQRTVILEYVDLFMEENPHITVEMQGTNSNDIITSLVAQATNPTDIPTLFFTAADQVATLHDLGLTENLFDWLDDDFLSKFAYGVVESTTMLNGDMGFFPYALQPQGILYRVDRFEELGLEIPTNWDEFVDVAIALTRDSTGGDTIDEWGYSLIGINNGSGQARFLAYLWSNGFDIIYQDEDGQWATDISMDPEFIEVFRRWTDMNNVHGVVPPGVTEIDFVMASNYFAMGITSLMFSGGNALGAIYDGNPDLRGYVGSFMLPGDYPGTMLGTEGYSLSAHATDAEKEAAIALLKFLLENDEELMFWQVSGKLPSTEAGLQAEFMQSPDQRGYIDQVNAGARPTITFPGVAGLRSELGDAYSAVFSEEMTVEEAVARLIDRMEMLLADFN